MFDILLILRSVICNMPIALPFVAALLVSPSAPSLQVPRIVIPHEVFEDEIIVYHPKPRGMPITERVDERGVDIVPVTDGVLQGSGRIDRREQNADRAWEEMAKITGKAVSTR